MDTIPAGEMPDLRVSATIPAGKIPNPPTSATISERNEANLSRLASSY